MKKTLVLKRETVRKLTHEELYEAVGGKARDPSAKCSITPMLPQIPDQPALPAQPLHP